MLHQNESSYSDSDFNQIYNNPDTGPITIPFPLGSKRWDNACAYQRPPLDQLHCEVSYSTVEVVELWTVFHERYSLLGQSNNMGCCISTDHRLKL